MQTAILYDATVVARTLGLNAVSDAPELPEHLGDAAYATYYDPGLSVIQMRMNPVIRRRRLIRVQTWYDVYAWAMQSDFAGYRQLRLPLACEGRTYRAQLTQLREDETVASVRSLLVFLTLHALIGEERLLAGSIVRTSDTDLVGDHVRVGNFTPAGIGIFTGSDSTKDENIGLAVARSTW